MEETTQAASLLSFLPQVLAGIQGLEEHIPDEILSDNLSTCESCGTSWSDFKKIGFLGCGSCYEAFGDSLLKVIREFQESEEHIGKAPAKLPEKARLRRKLLELEKRLERQIAEEHYEAAASVRDQIREIEGKLKETVEKSDKE
ncbi:MAG: UvrB/UvrC motif-containing protein [Actinomycetota bacterium]|nr:UvrB/UvrC motif-containing protein [Actinomycetota bacterium]